MLNFLKNLLGQSEPVNYHELIASGAIIVDVRTKGEFERAHMRNSLNIPLDKLEGKLNALKDKEKAIICCCESGMRSSTARKILMNAGYMNVYNAGSWRNLNK